MRPEPRGVRLDSVSKRYVRQEGRVSLRALLFEGKRRHRGTGFWALQDVCLEVRPGTSTGLIGGNGAGKSTLLRLAAGLSQPTSGTIAVPRDTLSVLGLGASFDGTLTGAENAQTALVVNGTSRRGAAERMEAVREFAELEDFFESPVRTYSAGMGLRLAFAVAAQLQADAFLVDEVLSVGDLRFQEKCSAHLAGLRAAGATILMATHDLDQVETLCEEAVWLHAGRVRRSGPAAEVVAAYRDAMRSRTMEVTPAPAEGDAEQRLELRRNRFGSQELRLEDVLINGGPEASIDPGGALLVEARVAAGAEPRRLVLGVSVRRATDGLEVVKEHRELGVVRVDQRMELVIDRLDLAPGEYRIDVGAYEADWAVAYDYHWEAYRLRVAGIPRPQDGLLRPPVRWSIAEVASAGTLQPVARAEARPRGLP